MLQISRGMKLCYMPVYQSALGHCIWNAHYCTGVSILPSQVAVSYMVEVFFQNSIKLKAGMRIPLLMCVTFAEKFRLWTEYWKVQNDCHKWFRFENHLQSFQANYVGILSNCQWTISIEHTCETLTCNWYRLRSLNFYYTIKITTLDK